MLFRSYSRAYGAVAVGLIVFTLASIVLGLIIFSLFKFCDPLTDPASSISNKDQVTYLSLIAYVPVSAHCRCSTLQNVF